MANSIHAELVYDGSADVRIPAAMGCPREDQMQGTPLERLAELAGRICYDSLGTGRPSRTVGNQQGYHDHIKETRHRSVLEHHPLVVQFDLDHFGAHYQTVANGLFRACANRPGVTTRLVSGLPKFRVCANLRSIIEWSEWTEGRFSMGTSLGNIKDVHAAVGGTLTAIAHELAPQIVGAPAGVLDDDFAPVLEGALDDPVYEDEMWATLFLSGSRALSHEQVRHRYMTAVSQRSTRYCDEDESAYVVHPLLVAYLKDADGKSGVELLESKLHQASFAAREAYRFVVSRLSTYLDIGGITGTAVRKQARGAARGFLGNALYTEMLFSASVAQWKWMLQLRASAAADAEIRQLYAGTEDGSACVLAALQASQFGAFFSGYAVKDSSDGVGRIVVS